MKVRKFLFAGALLVATLFSVNSVMAQTTDKVTVNLKFRPVQAIVVTSGTEVVDLVYATKTDYSNGKSETVNDHLEIFSMGGFEVKVNAAGDFTNGTNTKTIPVGDVQIVATEGSQNGSGEITFASKASLTTSANTLLSATGGGTAIKYNVEYDNTDAGGSNKYFDKYIAADGNESVYTTTVTYSIAAK